MSRLSTNGTAALFLLLAFSPILRAVDPNSTTVSAPAPNPTGNPDAPYIAPGPVGLPPAGSTPSMMALPVQPNVGDVPLDSSTVRKFYTISASLRETYDTNVNTVRTNPQSSYETSVSPSLLLDFPRPEGDISARYTFGATYYSNYGNQNNGASGSSGSNNNGNNSSIQLSNEFVAQLTHTFSNRFSLSMAEDFRQFQEPSLMESTGTEFRNGEYISNAFNANLTAQWTPLFGTQTSYSNTLIRYDESDVAQDQNYTEHTGSENLSYSLTPTVSATFGGIVDDISYQFVDRGYINYTAYFGAQWSALPSLNFTLRGGGSYTQVSSSLGSSSQDSFAPYAAASVSWSLGARSQLSAEYAHEVTPNDNASSNGQQSDRITTSFQYMVTSRITTHLQAIFTYANVSGNFLASGTQPGYTETQYAADAGITYTFDKYIGIDADVNYSGIDSELADRDYTRAQFSIGVRGTY